MRVVCSAAMKSRRSSRSSRTFNFLSYGPWPVGTGFLAVGCCLSDDPRPPFRENEGDDMDGICTMYRLYYYHNSILYPPILIYIFMSMDMDMYMYRYIRGTRSEVRSTKGLTLDLSSPSAARSLLPNSPHPVPSSDDSHHSQLPHRLDPRCPLPLPASVGSRHAMSSHPIFIPSHGVAASAAALLLRHARYPGTWPVQRSRLGAGDSTLQHRQTTCVFTNLRAYNMYRMYMILYCM
jgi:hypothetical protein